MSLLQIATCLHIVALQLWAAGSNTIVTSTIFDMSHHFVLLGHLGQASLSSLQLGRIPQGVLRGVLSELASSLRRPHEASAAWHSGHTFTSAAWCRSTVLLLCWTFLFLRD